MQRKRTAPLVRSDDRSCSSGRVFPTSYQRTIPYQY
nr:MAG TPA: hypothetical protein [Caudoviricetes sp.]DAZ36359.1 MAG TPA: hypothetical protein [Caudoviricetes sp.]